MNKDCKKETQSTIDFIIFGATGDLAHKKLFPSLFNLYKDFKFKEKIKILALGRSPQSSEEFVKRFDDTIAQSTQRDDFYKIIEYFPCDFTNIDELKKLKDKLDAACASRIFYLAIPPLIYPDVISNLESVGLNKTCDTHSTFSRVILEKPFGEDLESSKKLNKIILSGFQENQIYRIDHYLGKEPVQNIFSFRFANNTFENIWDCKYVDNIQIRILEDMGIEGRGEFYDSTGALVDVFQNHALQMLSILTMDKPKEFEENYIREEKNTLLKSLVFKDCIKGQYEGYTSEDKVSPDSKRETYVAVKLEIANERWNKVPIFIETGKYLNERRTEISVVMKKNKDKLFKGNSNNNVLKFLIYPDLGIELKLLGKVPTFSNYEVTDIDMKYKYSNFFGELKSEYEKLLIDCIQGEQINFTRSDEIENAWVLVDSIQKEIKDKTPIIYPKSSKGPKETIALLKKDTLYWV